MRKLASELAASCHLCTSPDFVRRLIRNMKHLIEKRHIVLRTVPGSTWSLPLFFTLVLLTSTVARGQAWSGIINVSRAVDWSSAGVTGGIPNRTTVCATLNPGATTAQINSAISSCPTSQVVSLNSGTYNLTGSINITHNVTLRGAGASKTILVFSGSAASCQGGNAAICVNGIYNGSWWPGPPGPNGAPASQTVSWVGTNGQTGVYTKGATVLNLASAPTGLQVGWILMLSQNDDSAVSPTNLWAGGDCTLGMSLDGSGDTYGTGQQQNVKVVAINGTQVTVSPGIYMSNWRTTQKPQVYWFGAPASGVGIENLQLQTASVSGLTTPIALFAAADSWVKGVSTAVVPAGARAHVRLVQSSHLTVADSYFSGSAGSGQLNYGVEPYDCSDCLIQNNIFDGIVSPVLPQAGSEGVVIAYNYVNNPQHDFQLHQEGNTMMLLEGNAAGTILIDTFHGTNLFTTIFRNRLAGTTVSATSGVAAIDIWANDRYNNILGNVLGTAGKSNQYESSNPASPTSGWGPIIYRFGFPYIDPVTSYGAGSGRCTNQLSINFDALVPTSTFRWGNYDTVNGAVRFVSSEVPASLSQYANAVPATQTLPASLYLPGKPSWWPAAKPWPSIGPDVTGGNIASVGGHAYTIPAQDCYTSIGGNQGSFNAATCYVSNSSPPPAPPTSLADVVN